MPTKTYLAVLFAAATLPACLSNVDVDEMPSSNGSELTANDPDDPDAPPSCTVDNEGDVITCAHNYFDLTGTRECEVTDYEGELYAGWSACAYEGEEPTCGDGYAWDGACCKDTSLGACCEHQTEPCNTPLVLHFDDAPVTYTTQMEGDFDLTGLGMTAAHDWPTAATPWLALDRDGNRRIDGGEELFGSATALSSGAVAAHGFEALAELDTDEDGRITPRDSAWSKLLVSCDFDRSRTSEPHELLPLAAHGVTFLDLGYAVDARCDERGNCERERARMGLRVDGQVRTGEVIDVHLRVQSGR